MRKWTIRQFEWYRDNKIFITVSNLRVWGGFLRGRHKPSRNVYISILHSHFSPNSISKS